MSPRDFPTMDERDATLRGVATALFVFVPMAILNELARDLFGIFMVLILLGAGSGGYAVRRLCPTAPLSRSAAAPAIAYAVVQGLGVLRRIAAGEPISWLAYPFLALLVATVGMLGGMLARRQLRMMGVGEGDG